MGVNVSRNQKDAATSAIGISFIEGAKLAINFSGIGYYGVAEMVILNFRLIPPMDGTPSFLLVYDLTRNCKVSNQPGSRIALARLFLRDVAVKVSWWLLRCV